MTNLDTLVRKLNGELVKVELTRPLYLVGDNESYMLSEKSDISRLPTIREVIGYLTRFEIRKQWIQHSSYSEEVGHIVVNPFGKDHLTMNEEGRRAGDVFIDLRYVRKLDKI